MRKHLALFIALVCILSLSSCINVDKPNIDNGTTENTVESGTININPEYAKTINNFSKYLNKEGFVPGLSQSQFIELMEKYSYNGEKQTIAQFDGLQGSGCLIYGEQYSGSNAYGTTLDKKYANYWNSFNTRVALDGLVLPYGLCFDDELSDVFRKINISLDPYGGFVLDKDSNMDMTLLRDDKSTLVLSNKTLTKESTEVNNSYELIYTETYQITRKDGSDATVTRTITFTFSSNESGNKLNSFNMKVNEYFPLQRS